MQQIIDKFLAFITPEMLVAFILGLTLIIIVPTVYYWYFLKPIIDKAKAQKSNPLVGAKKYKLKGK